MDLKCELEIPSIPNLKDQELTVGRYSLLHCEGEFDKSFDFSKAELKVKEPQKLIIKLFHAEARSIQSFDLKLAFYKPGGIEFTDVMLSDGQKEIKLPTFKTQLQSVIQQNNKAPTQEPPKPFGYAIPYFEWPLIYWILICSFLLIISFPIGLYFYKKNRIKKLKAIVASYNDFISPETQFYKKIRELEKQDYPFQDFKKCVLILILRLFQIPVFHLSEKKCINILKKETDFSSDLLRRIYHLLVELNHYEMNSIDKKRYPKQIHTWLAQVDIITKEYENEWKLLKYMK